MIPGVPYDAEIEYLQSTGTQWIDTEVVVAYHKIVARIQQLQYINERSLFGVWNNDSPKSIFQITYYNQKYYFGCSRSSERNIGIPNGFNTDWHIYEISAEGYFKLDGVLLYTDSGSYVAGRRTIAIFGRTVNGNIERATLAYPTRISAFKIINLDTNSLVRDLIPVRVGQTGYMYDRVSRRLFGNKGTGSFVLGPDVAKSVMGLWGMKQITYVPSDYVTDGIVAWYDGEWNAGWNKHDANAQTWKDLSGEGNDATIVKRDTFDRSFTFDSNSCTMDGTFCWSFTASNSVINAVKGDCTIEVIRKLGTPSLQDSTPFFGLNIYGSRAMSMAGTTNNMKFAIGVGEVHVINSTRPGISIAATKHIDGTTIYVIGYEKGTQRTAETRTLQTTMVNSNGVLFGAGTNLFGGKGRYWEPSPPADGHAYTLRFYNRVLSPDEIAHNYAIDKARFNLP